MVRSNCVREGASQGEVPFDEKAPADEAAEALIQKSRCQLFEKNDDFITSFRRIAQARDIVLEVVELWKEVDQRRPLESYEHWERSVAQKNIAEAFALARECYPGDIIAEFHKVFGVSYDQFWASLEELHAKFGSA